MKFEKYFDRKQQRNCWRFDFTIAGERIRAGGFAKKQHAENAVAAIRLLVERKKYGLPAGRPGHTIGSLLKKMEDDSTISSRKITIFRQFVELIGSSVLIVELRRGDFVRFLEFTQSKDLANASQKNYLDNVLTCLNNAGAYYPSLDDYRPPKPPPRPRPDARRRILTKAELGIFFKAIVQPRYPGERLESIAIRLKIFDLARLMLLTASRREHLMTIRPEDLRADSTLALESSKVHRIHHIALGGLAFRILQTRIEKTPAGKDLFEGINNQMVTKVMTRVATYADINYGQRAENGWSLHDLRRTAATVIEDAGLPYSAVSAQLGHKRADITARYTVPQIATMRKAVEILENWCRDIDGIFWGCGELSGVAESRPLEGELRKAQ